MELTLDELDTRLAQSAAELLKTILKAARLREPQAAETIDTLTACRLIITAERQAIQIELLAPVEGGTLRLYGATFNEQTLQ